MFKVKDQDSGVSHTQHLHYIDPTLAEGNDDTAIIQVGINDATNDNNTTKVEDLVLNFERIVIKLKNMELKTYVYVF